MARKETLTRLALILLAAWPLLLAAGGRAPLPPGDFAGGVVGVPRALGTALDDVRAAGFDSMRVFLRWDKIETVEGRPNWSCKYHAVADRGPDLESDGPREPWPGTPCDGTPCGCGWSADERVAQVAAGPKPFAIVLTILGTPAWARGPRAAHCPADVPERALPLREGKERAFADFVAAAARRYGDVAYAFELWNEPDQAACRSWAGTREQYRRQILGAASAVKATGVTPGLVVAPTLVRPSGAAMDAWMDWSAPVDVLSFNLYTATLAGALAKIDEMSAWCRKGSGCPGFYVTEFGARRAGPKDCPGPKADAPGPADVAIMQRCRSRRPCKGFFLYALSDQKKRPECDRGLFDVRGCRKQRLCTIARRFFGVTKLPYACEGCGP